MPLMIMLILHVDLVTTTGAIIGVIALSLVILIPIAIVLAFKLYIKKT